MSESQLDGGATSPVFVKRRNIPVDYWLEYTDFMKIGQLKLSERKKHFEMLNSALSNSGQGKTFKIQLKDEWLYCSQGMEDIVEN